MIEGKVEAPSWLFVITSFAVTASLWGLLLLNWKQW
jgi:hypothetical protein